MPTTFAPVALFVFNRPQHTQKTIESLQGNTLASETDLYVFADGPRHAKDIEGVAAVRALIQNLSGFKSIVIHERETNQGLANSIIAGVSQLMNAHGRAIVVEDDLQLSPAFLSYMNEALERYEADRRVQSIGGYSPKLSIPASYTHDSFLSYRCCTWGWASWRDRWDRVDWVVEDFDQFEKDEEQVARFNRGGDDMIQIFRLQMAGKLNSWGIRWDYAHFRNDAYCFRPVESLVYNLGHDGSGVHCAPTDQYDVELSSRVEFRFPKPFELQLDEEINRSFATFYDGRPRKAGEAPRPMPRRSVTDRLISRARRMVGLGA